MAISDLLAQISGEAPTSKDAVQRAQPVVPKRKAETELARSNGKYAKTEQQMANSSRPIAPARGLSSSSKITREEPSKAGSRGGVEATRNGADTAKAAPPKKGSHAEIMARAKAGQVAYGQVGKIQHKKIEKGPSKVVGKAGPAVRTGRSAGGSSWSKTGKLSQVDVPNEKGGRPTDKGGYAGTAKAGNKANGKKAARLPMDEPVKKIKKAAIATTGYTGTARPNPALAKTKPRGSISSAAAPPRRDSAPASSLKSTRNARHYSYEDEDEEEEEEEEDYESDVSSDMEAAGFEVDEEEERALRIAKQEDIAEEKRLKREAEEKRKRLAAMRAGR